MTTSGWPEDSEVLYLARRSDRCTVLGPGMRAVLWVQGCPLRCPGCVAAETLPFEGGNPVGVNGLATELAALPDIEGVTFSGGEPTAQAAALCNLMDRLRGVRPLSFVSYSGFTLEHLRHHGNTAVRAFLDRLDVLIDGPYVEARHTDLRWRGSDNQRVHFLSDRYRHLAAAVRERGTWLEVEIDPGGHGVHWMGIPPRGFRERFERQIEAAGIRLPQRQEEPYHE